MVVFCSVLISATSEDEANLISKSLVKKKLVAGTMITRGNCHYWWDNEVCEKVYWNISAFSLLGKKDVIISEVKRFHSDECPIVAFNVIDGNKEFLDWISDNIK